jgi:hypothetical protein
MAMTQKERNDLPVNKAKRLALVKLYKQTMTGRLRTLLQSARHNAKKAGRTVNLTYEQLLDLYNKQGGKCALTGRVLSFNTGDINIISIDRIDNNIDYQHDNIQLITWQANRAKHNSSTEEFIALCKDVVKRQQTAG